MLLANDLTDPNDPMDPMHPMDPMADGAGALTVCGPFVADARAVEMQRALWRLPGGSRLPTVRDGARSGCR
jgi:hypothetical protein